MINLSRGKVLCCSWCMEERDNAASKINRDQREWPPQQTEKRGSNCSVEWSRSISSPSRARGAANWSPQTTHRDKRVWTSHWLNERLNRQTSEVQMSQWRDKKFKSIKLQTKKKKIKIKNPVWTYKNEEENKKHGGPPKAPESWEMD